MLNLIKKYPIVTFILCCLIPVHSILWTALYFGASPDSLKPLKLPFALLPSISAIVITFIIGDYDAVEKLWKRTVVSTTPKRIYLIALFSFISIGFLTLAIRYFFDGYLPKTSDFAPIWQILFFSPLLLLFPGFAEEFGWRGFMQDRLNSRMLPFFASIVVGLTWGTWHGMDFLMGNWSPEYWSILLFFVYIIGVSIIIGEIYARSGGNIFIAMLVHFSANAVNFFMPVWKTEGGFQTPIIFLILIWTVAIIIVVKQIFSFKKAKVLT